MDDGYKGGEDGDGWPLGYEHFPRPRNNVSENGSVSTEDSGDANNPDSRAHGVRGDNHDRDVNYGDGDAFPAGPPGDGMPYRDASRIISEANTAAILKALSEMGLLRPPRREPETLGVTGHELSSGLEILSARRTSAQAARAGVASKHKRGDTELQRLKTKQVVVEKIPGGLGVSKIMQVLASNNPEEFDLAVDAQAHQVSLRTLRDVFYANDMVTPFMIPEYFDLDDPSSVKGPFINLLETPTLVPDEKVYDWTRFLKKFAAPVELESATWAGEIMDKSMDADLKTRVHDDLEELPEYAKGGVTVFKIMTKHMILQSQEITEGLHAWIRDFDIRQYDGENVTVAVGHCKAVLRALVSSGIPPNTPRDFLNGFAKASTPEFVQLCVSLATTLKSPLLQSQQQVNMPVKKLCFHMLQDLENLFIEKQSRHLWLGTGHDGKVFRATLSGQDLEANAARRDNRWTTDKACHGCGKVGHLVRDCPERRDADARSPRRENSDNARSTRRRDNEHKARRAGDKTHRSKRDRFEKAFTMALETLANEASSSESEKDDASPRAHAAVKNDGHKSDGDNSLAAHAARMYASLKE